MKCRKLLECRNLDSVCSQRSCDTAAGNAKAENENMRLFLQDVISLIAASGPPESHSIHWVNLFQGSVQMILFELTTTHRDHIFQQRVGGTIRANCISMNF